MARLGPRGENFKFEEAKLTIFDRSARSNGQNWLLGRRLSDGDYLESIVSPAPARGLLEEVISIDRNEGKIMEIIRVDVSADIAARLYLENFITRDQFRAAFEGVHRTPLGSLRGEFVCLPEIQFPGDLTLPLCIYAVDTVGEVFVATINNEGKIV